MQRAQSRHHTCMRRDGGQAAGIWKIRANAGMGKEEIRRQKASTGVDM